MPRGTGRGRGPEVGRDLEGRSRLIWVSTVPSATAVVSSLGEASAWEPASCVPGVAAGLVRTGAEAAWEGL